MHGKSEVSLCNHFERYLLSRGLGTERALSTRMGSVGGIDRALSVPSLLRGDISQSDCIMRLRTFHASAAGMRRYAISVKKPVWAIYFHKEHKKTGCPLLVTQFVYANVFSLGEDDIKVKDSLGNTGMGLRWQQGWPVDATPYPTDSGIKWLWRGCSPLIT